MKQLRSQAFLFFSVASASLIALAIALAARSYINEDTLEVEWTWEEASRLHKATYFISTVPGSTRVGYDEMEVDQSDELARYWTRQMHKGPNYSWHVLGALQPSALSGFSGPGKVVDRWGFLLRALYPKATPDFARKGWTVGLPFWFLAILLAVAPAIKLRLAFARRKSRRAGLCPTCGYDLRASQGRCPECGRSSPTTQNQP